MPHFVPVYDPERPRAEQSTADPALRVHRRWETPHALLPIAARKGDDEKDDRPVKLKPVRSKMARNEKGLWVPIAQAKGEAARREERLQGAFRKWCRPADEEIHDKVVDNGRCGGWNGSSAFQAAKLGSGERVDRRSDECSAARAAAAVEGSSYDYECEERCRSRSHCLRVHRARESDTEALSEKTAEGDCTHPTYKSTKRHQMAAGDLGGHARGVTSYHRREFRSRSRERYTREDEGEGARRRKLGGTESGRRSKSSSPCRGCCGATHATVLALGFTCEDARIHAEDYRRESPQGSRRLSSESKVTLANVTAPSGKIDMFDYMTKKQKALLRQQTSSLSALPRRR